jgi:hypothetical protein
LLLDVISAGSQIEFQVLRVSNVVFRGDSLLAKRRQAPDSAKGAEYTASHPLCAITVN